MQICFVFSIVYFHCDMYDGQKTDKNVYVTLCRVCWWSSSCKLIRLCPMRRGREPSIP